MDITNIHEMFQSAYNRLHNTERALLWVQMTFLVPYTAEIVYSWCLDLSLAFEKINYNICIEWLALQLGFKERLCSGLKVTCINVFNRLSYNTIYSIYSQLSLIIHYVSNWLNWQSLTGDRGEAFPSFVLANLHTRVCAISHSANQLSPRYTRKMWCMCHCSSHQGSCLIHSTFWWRRGGLHILLSLC